MIMKEQIMNMTSAKLSNHHLAGVRKAPKYSVQTRSDTPPWVHIALLRRRHSVKTSLLHPSSSFRDVPVKCLQTLPLCRRSAHNWV